MIAKITIFVLFAGMVLGVVCPAPKPVIPPFQYDPAKCAYRIIGSVQMNVGDSFAISISACDPDGDPMVFVLDNQPDGMSLQLSPAEPNTVVLIWKATKADIYYPNIIVTDMPADGLPLFDRGTIVVRVWKSNQAPVLLNCGNGDLSFDGRVDFVDFAMFAACWLKGTNNGDNF